MSLKTFQNRTCPRISFALSMDAIVSDVARAMVCNLKGVGQTLTSAQMQSLLNGIAIFFNNVTNNVMMSGPVNVAILMLALRLRPGTRVVNKRTVCDVNYTLQTTSWFPYNLASPSDLSEFFRANKQIGGLFMEYSDAVDVDEHVIVDGMKFDFQTGLAPNGTVQHAGGYQDLFFYRSDRTAGTKWLDLLAWGRGVSGPRLIEGAFLEQADWVVDFPFLSLAGSGPGTNPAGLPTAGSVILTYGLQNPRVLFADTFKFPVYSPEVVAHYLRADLAARAAAGFTTTVSTTDITVHLSLAHAALTKVGVKSGNVAYLNYYDVADQAVLPQSVIESCLADCSVRDGLAILPHVFTASYPWIAGPDYIATVFGDAAYTGASFATLILSGNYFSYWNIFNSPAFLTSVGRGWVAANAPSNDNWGTLPTGASATFAFAPLNTFSNSISYGNLGNPMQDKKVGRWNPADTSLEYNWSVTTANVFTFTSLSAANSYSPVVKTFQHAKFVGKLPIPLEGIRHLNNNTTAVTGTFMAGSLFKTRAVLSDRTPGITLANITVTESSAKSTTYQAMMNELNQMGAGGDSFLGSVVRYAGRGANLIGQATGFGLVGKSVEIVANKFADIALQDSNTASRKGNSVVMKPRPTRAPSIRQKQGSRGGQGASARNVAVSSIKKNKQQQQQQNGRRRNNRRR